MRTNFAYDGQDVIKDINSDGTTVEYLNGPGIDNKIRQKGSSTSTTYYFSQDHLGSTTALTGTTGKLVERQTYDAYGNSAGSTRTRYGYTGRERELLASLLYYRARFYDPQLGRFISEDPIGLEGGINPFMYVGNDPVDSRDPQGLWPSQGPFKIHQKILNRVLTGRATPEQLRIMMQEQGNFDRATQDEVSAYKHAMRARWETPEAARKKANWFVRYNICNARRLAATGRIPEAMRLLSPAIHTLQGFNFASTCKPRGCLGKQHGSSHKPRSSLCDHLEIRLEGLKDQKAILTEESSWKTVSISYRK